MHIDTFELRNNVIVSAYKDMGDPQSVADPRVNFSSFNISDELTDGAVADKANLVYATSFRLAPSGTKTVDLYGGSDTDAFGDTLYYSLVKLVRVICVEGSQSGTPTVSLSGNFCTTHTLDAKIATGGYADFFRPDATGYAVAAGSSDAITITNDSSSETVDVKLLVVGVRIDASSSSSSSSSSTESSSSSSSASSSSSSSSSSESSSST